jgi:dipeptidyl aminopeptidase/acylaminoacyl peptidase
MGWGSVFAGGVAGLFVATVACAQTKPTLPPIETYAGLPTFESVDMSPDGKRLAFLQEVNGERNLVIFDRASKKVVRAARIGTQKVRGFTWVDDNHVLVTVSTTGVSASVISSWGEWFLGLVIEVSSGAQRLLLSEDDAHDSAETMNVLEGMPEVRKVDGRTYIFAPGVAFADSRGVSALMRSETDGRNKKIVLMGSEDTRGWSVGPDGKTVVRIDFNPRTHRWTLLVKHPNQPFQERWSVIAPIETPSVLGFDEAGTGVILDWIGEGDPEADKHIYRLEIDGAAPPAVWREAFSDNVIPDPSTHAIIGVADYGYDVQTDFFSDHDKAQWAVIEKTFPGHTVRLRSWSADRKILVLQLDGPEYGSSYMIVDLNTGQAGFIGDRYQGLGPKQMGEVVKITYKAKDGMDIPALVTMPPGGPKFADAKNLPLIVLPHGGPAVSDSSEYDYFAQSVASRGYVVLQPQFRGSGGFGQHHLEAGYGQWGRKMQTDLSDGVSYLADKGVIDPKRVAIMGASYGGYAALAGVSLQQGVYRCAVSIAGVGDLRLKLSLDSASYSGPDSNGQRYWKRFMGVKSMDDPALEAISPARHIADIKVPVLLIHGKDDSVVDYAQSTTFFDAMKAAGKPVEFITLNHEDHWLSRKETRIQAMSESVRFLSTCNPPN